MMHQLGLYTAGREPQSWSHTVGVLLVASATFANPVLKAIVTYCLGFPEAPCQWYWKALSELIGVTYISNGIWSGQHQNRKSLWPKWDPEVLPWGDASDVMRCQGWKVGETRLQENRYLIWAVLTRVLRPFNGRGTSFLQMALGELGSHM